MADGSVMRAASVGIEAISALISATGVGVVVGGVASPELSVPGSVSDLRFLRAEKLVNGVGEPLSGTANFTGEGVAFED